MLPSVKVIETNHSRTRSRDKRSFMGETFKVTFLKERHRRARDPMGRLSSSALKWNIQTDSIPGDWTIVFFNTKETTESLIPPSVEE